eukprot:2225788-Rhodomonas_salina.1
MPGTETGYGATIGTEMGIGGGTEIGYGATREEKEGSRTARQCRGREGGRERERERERGREGERKTEATRTPRELREDQYYSTRERTYKKQKSGRLLRWNPQRKLEAVLLLWKSNTRPRDPRSMSRDSEVVRCRDQVKSSRAGWRP